MLFCNPRVTKIEMAVKRQIPAFVARTLAIRRFDRKAHNVAGRKYNTTTATNTNAKNGRDTTNASTIYKNAGDYGGDYCGSSKLLFTWFSHPRKYANTTDEIRPDFTH